MAHRPVGPSWPQALFMNRGLKSACLVLLLLLFPACSRQKTAPEASRENPSQLSSGAVLNLAPDLTSRAGNTFQATFTAKVVKMDQEAFLTSIRSISSDNSTFVFDPSAAAASRLQEGSILFVPAIALRKVDVAARQDGQLVVVTLPCQKARLISTISVGANATILGKEKGKVQKDIFYQEKTMVVPPTQSCDV